ncbi:MAG: DegT/DnrJ/EryC1/StrS family aminotransferase [Thermoguttaceae bacterium]|jgi:dTDP-4-amino-4,6-dideoxygalactose transaminase
MWSRKRLDIGWSDLLFGISRVCFPLKQAGIDQFAQGIFSNPEHILAFLSVRSGFDLLLGKLGLPKGSEVLVSAITIPDMIRIIEHHGLVPVPVDLDPRQMAPNMENWRRAVTPATRAILAAHLFGGRILLEPILELAGQKKLLVIEDCAQAYAGPGYQGHSGADASMFSFGTIKSGTALGGALLRVRDPELLARMRAAQAGYEKQNRWLYGKRLLKYAILKTLSSRPISAFFVRMCMSMDFDYDRWVNRAARGFPGEGFFEQIRQQPCTPLLAVLKRRLKRFNSHRLERHVKKGHDLAELLGENVFCPGAANRPHTYWVFPVLVNEPEGLIEHLARAGFDATQGQSLCVVPPPADRPEQKARTAEEILAKIVFLPFYPELPPREATRMAEEMLKVAGRKWAS